MNILFTLLIIIVAILMMLGFVGFFLDTIQHNKWLNEQEKYWDDVKKQREEKEANG